VGREHVCYWVEWVWGTAYGLCAGSEEWGLGQGCEPGRIHWAFAI